MIGLPPGAKVWLAAGATDMRRGFDGLAALVQSELSHRSVLRPAFHFQRQSRRSD